jgi:anti-sigma28 factor (negative regulator of flagellin synthesis)
MAGTSSGEDIARAARVAELRRLVASGRYKVEPRALAAKILARALQQG